MEVAVSLLLVAKQGVVPVFVVEAVDRLRMATVYKAGSQRQALKRHPEEKKWF